MNLDVKTSLLQRCNGTTSSSRGGRSKDGLPRRKQGKHSEKKQRRRAVQRGCSTSPGRQRFLPPRNPFFQPYSVGVYQMAKASNLQHSVKLDETRNKVFRNVSPGCDFFLLLNLTPLRRIRSAAWVQPSHVTCPFHGPPLPLQELQRHKPMSRKNFRDIRGWR